MFSIRFVHRVQEVGHIKEISQIMVHGWYFVGRYIACRLTSLYYSKHLILKYMFFIENFENTIINSFTGSYKRKKLDILMKMVETACIAFSILLRFFKRNFSTKFFLWIKVIRNYQKKSIK